MVKRSIIIAICFAAWAEEAIQNGGGHDGVTGKDFSPMAERFVRGAYDGAVVVITLRDHLKEKTGLSLVQLQVTHLINDQ